MKLMREQKSEKCLNLQTTIYRYILSKEKSLFLLPASTLDCVLDPMTYNEINSAQRGRGFMLYEAVVAKCREV